MKRLAEPRYRERAPATGNRFDDPREQVRLAEKARNERVHRPLVQLDTRSNLHDTPGAHDRNAVGHHERLLLIVRHVDGRPRARGVQAADLELHLLAQLPIERAQRLVHQQDVRLDHDRAGERHPLLLAAGELADRTPAVAGQARHAERFVDALGNLLLREAAHGETVADVLGDRHVRKQRVVLEHHPHVAKPRRQRRDIAAGDDHAAGRRREITGADVEQRRLAGAGRAEQRQELALAKLEVRRFERADAAKGLADAGELHGAHWCTPTLAAVAAALPPKGAL